MVIFNRCHRSSAAVTHDKYERDLKYLTYTFTKSSSVTKKLTNGAFVTLIHADTDSLLRGASNITVTS